MSRYVDVDTFDDTVQKLNDQGWHITRIDYKRMDRVLFEMPTADVVEVKHGKWIEEDSGAMYCTACGEYPLFASKTNYCPNCGADMRGEEDEIQGKK